MPGFINFITFVIDSFNVNEDNYKSCENLVFQSFGLKALVNIVPDFDLKASFLICC